MKKISNWSLLGFIGAILFIIISIYRYWFLYNDIDKFIAYTTIGILIFAVSWLYNKQLQHSISIEVINDYLADKQEAEK